MTNKTNKYTNTLHQGCKASTHEHARQLRKTSTETEQKLWSILRNRQVLGKKFRRQHAIVHYILDFYCHECKLAIEVDGNYHNNEEAKEYDELRTKILNEYGITVLRFWNEDVMKNVEKVLETIKAHLY